MSSIFTRTLPPIDEMYRASLERDTSYEGIFIMAVKTTGIFCRPSCPAKKPGRENVEFFASTKDALAHGYRPCKRCHPMEPRGAVPAPIKMILDELEADAELRLRDGDLRERGIDPASLRRWFLANHGMTFHAYQRARRMARALGQLAGGSEIVQTAFENGYDSLSGFQDALRKITGRSPSRSRAATIVHLARVLTPLGPMLAGATEEGLALLEFTDRRMLATQLERLARRLDASFVPGSNDIIAATERELAAYFAGELKEFTVPLVMAGSDFQQDVWSALRTIPYGQTRSYADQAVMIGKPSAVRAVARANGDNRIAIIIPCHRVIGADGMLTGYGGGLWRKSYLLEHEKGMKNSES